MQAKGPNFIPFGRKGTKFKYPARLIVRPPYSIKANQARENYDKNYPPLKRNAQSKPLRIKKWSEIVSKQPAKQVERKTDSATKVSSVDTKRQLRKIDFSSSGRLLVDVFKNRQRSTALIDNGATHDIMSIDFLKSSGLLDK